MTTSSSRWRTVPIIVVLLFVVVLMPKPVRRPLREVVGAPSYVFPELCPPADYGLQAIGTIIACSCADPKYRIVDWHERGLDNGTKTTPAFFQIRNDAIDIGKYAFGFQTGKCYISWVQRDFFVDRPTRHDGVNHPS